MQYVDFRDAIQRELRRNPEGLTWVQLKEHLDLSYDRPCQTWVYRMEEEIGLTRVRGTGRAFVWKLQRNTARG